MNSAGAAPEETQGPSGRTTELLEGRGEANTERSYVFGLDVVRAAAVSMVVLTHTFTNLQTLGVAGVELFFALSGYLVGGVFLKGIERDQRVSFAKILKFCQRRWARTIPNYALFLVIWYGVVPPYHVGATDLARYVFFLQNLYTPIPAFFIASWSLAVEEWFYVVLPLASWIAILATGRARMSVTIVSLAIVAASIMLRSLPTVDDVIFGMRMVVIYRLDALAIGVLARVGAERRPDLWRAAGAWWPLAALAFFAVSDLLIVYRHDMSNVAANGIFLILPVSACMLVARATRLRETPGWTSAVAKKGSQWSYSLYLCHYPILFLVPRTPGYNALPPAGQGVLLGMGVLLAITVSAGIYVLYERPMLGWLSPRIRHVPAPRPDRSAP